MRRGRNRIQEVIYYFPMFTQTKIIENVLLSNAIGSRLKLAVNMILIRGRIS